MARGRLRKADLSVVVAATNTETANPLLHGEVTAINAFYALAADERPAARDCVFVATHEPCCLCLSALAWGGFSSWCTLFDYTDSRDAFGIPYDIDILQAVFHVGGGADAGRDGLYNRSNKMFTGVLLKDAIRALGDAALEARVAHLHEVYAELSSTYQKTKGALLLP